MAYQTKFRIAFTNDLGNLFEINLEYQNLPDQTVPIDIYALDGGIQLRVTGANDDKTFPINGTECNITVVHQSQTDISIADLVAETDTQVRVTVIVDNDKIFFQGFIAVEDNSQTMIGEVYTLSFRALDELGLLKGVDLVDANGLRFVGNYSIMSWFSQILFKTNQTLPIRVYFPIEVAKLTLHVGSGLPFPPITISYADYSSATFENIYLSSVTFSDGQAFNSAPSDPTVDINASTADDCFTALEKLIRNFRCRLFQQDGCWHIVSLYCSLIPSGEIDYTEYTIVAPTGGSGLATFNISGVGVSKLYNVDIGMKEIVQPVNDDQALYLKQPNKWIKLTYTYDQSQNKVANQDLSETAVPLHTYDENIAAKIIDPSYDPNNTGNSLPTYAFEVFGWKNETGTDIRGFPDVFNGLQSVKTTETFIRVVYDELNIYEQDRFCVVERTLSDVEAISWLRSSDILVDTGDKIDVNFNFRTRLSDPHHDFNAAILAYYGDDGTFWTLNSLSGEGPISQWVQYDAPFFTIQYMKVHFIGSTVWTQVLSGTTPIEVPGKGKLQLLLVGLTSNLQYGEAWFKNIQVTIYPYLLGTYHVLKGDYNYSSSGRISVKPTESDDVQISDSPKRYFKGSLIDSNGELLPLSYHRKDELDFQRFTQLMERILYNHNSGVYVDAGVYKGRALQKVEGSFRGIMYLNNDTSSLYDLRPLGLLNNYYFVDSKQPTKRYMLTSYTMDLTTGVWTGVFVECLKDENDDGWADPTQGGTQPNNYKFSYIFQ